jgi:hypothetical protein
MHQLKPDYNLEAALEQLDDAEERAQVIEEAYCFFCANQGDTESHERADANQRMADTRP